MNRLKLGIEVFAIAISLALPQGIKAEELETPVIDENTIIDVTEYGADGKDELSDKTAIQSCLDLADGTGATVFVPEGVYYINSYFRIGSNLTLKLDENAVIKRTPDAWNKCMMISKYHAEGYGAFHDLTIEGGTWDGNVPEDKHEDGWNLFYLWHGQNLTIKNATFKHACGDHFVEITGIKDAVIENCRFEDFIKNTVTDYDYKTDGSQNTSSPSSEAIQLDITASDSSKTATPLDKTPCVNVTVKGCTFKNCMSGVGTHHNSAYFNNIIIENNLFEDMYNTCINGRAIKGLTVRNNTAKRVRRFIYCWSGTEGTVKNNTCSYSSNNKISMMGFENSTVSCTGNTISSAGKSGIFVYNTKGKITLSDNKITVSNPSYAAYNISSCSNQVTITNKGSLGSYPLISKGGYGILVNKSLVYINKAYVAKTGKTGILIENASTVTISNSYIGSAKTTSYKAAKRGIYAEKSLVKIKNNKLYNCGNGGIGLAQLSGASYCFDNYISGVAGVGILVENSVASVHLKGNTIKNAKNNAISYINCYKVKSLVHENIITSPSKVGVRMENSYASVYDNQITKTGGSGIYILGKKSIINVTQNEIKSSGAYGIAVMAGRGNLSANTVVKSYNYDIYTEKGVKGYIKNSRVTKLSKIKNRAKVLTSKNKKA